MTSNNSSKKVLYLKSVNIETRINFVTAGALNSLGHSEFEQ
jgi:hypothetical protein